MGFFDSLFYKKKEILSEKIKAWLDVISTKEKMPSGIRAIYIGLFEGESTYQIYFSASRIYKSDNDDWACNQDFEPELKYLDSGILTSHDWQLFQKEVVEAISSVLNSTDWTILKRVEHVSVGFDSGDLINIV
jgi:hypothetical protein